MRTGDWKKLGGKTYRKMEGKRGEKKGKQEIIENQRIRKETEELN